MTGDNFTVVNRYILHEGSDPNGKVLDEMSEREFYSWLRSRGFPEDDAVLIVKQVAESGQETIQIP